MEGAITETIVMEKHIDGATGSTVEQKKNGKKENDVNKVNKITFSCCMKAILSFHVLKKNRY